MLYYNGHKCIYSELIKGKLMYLYNMNIERRHRDSELLYSAKKNAKMKDFFNKECVLFATF